MSKKLRLTCASYRTDMLEAKNLHMLSADHVNIRLVDTTDGKEGDSHSVNLTEESARQLFNWLGVWLHGGNRL